MRRILLISAVVAVLALVLVGAMAVQSQSGNSWQINYFPNENWQGAPVYSQTAPFLNMNWGSAAPGPNMPSQNWTARAYSTAYFYSGTYRYTIKADDEVMLTVDNVVYLDTRGQGQSGKTLVVDINMTQGNHNVSVDVRQYTGQAYLYLTWGLIKPGQGTPTPVIKPLPYPTPPPSATSVTTKYGDYTPCIQNNSHQSNCFQSDGAWNSPNVGSIQMEPEITVWGNCEPPDSDMTWTVDVNTDPVTVKSFRCSKTLAGRYSK